MGIDGKGGLARYAQLELEILDDVMIFLFLSATEILG